MPAPLPEGVDGHKDGHGEKELEDVDVPQQVEAAKDQATGGSIDGGRGEEGVIAAGRVTRVHGHGGETNEIRATAVESEMELHGGKISVGWVSYKGEYMHELSWRA